MRLGGPIFRETEQSGIRNVLSRVPAEDAAIAGNVALVVECSGHEQAALDACQVLRKRGELVLVGVPWRRQTDTYAHELLSLVFHKYVVLRSGWEWELPHHSVDVAPHSIHSGFDTALRWLADGRINTDNLISSANPREAQSIYQDLLHRKREELFSVFDWGQMKSQDSTNG